VGNFSSWRPDGRIPQSQFPTQLPRTRTNCIACVGCGAVICVCAGQCGHFRLMDAFTHDAYALEACMRMHARAYAALIRWRDELINYIYGLCIFYFYLNCVILFYELYNFISYNWMYIYFNKITSFKLIKFYDALTRGGNEENAATIPLLFWSPSLSLFLPRFRPPLFLRST
jgi:hypothetical protein